MDVVVDGGVQSIKESVDVDDSQARGWPYCVGGRLLAEGRDASDNSAALRISTLIITRRMRSYCTSEREITVPYTTYYTKVSGDCTLHHSS